MGVPVKAAVVKAAGHLAEGMVPVEWLGLAPPLQQLVPLKEPAPWQVRQQVLGWAHAVMVPRWQMMEQEPGRALTLDPALSEAKQVVAEEAVHVPVAAQVLAQGPQLGA